MDGLNLTETTNFIGKNWQKFYQILGFKQYFLEFNNHVRRRCSKNLHSS